MSCHFCGLETVLGASVGGNWGWFPKEPPFLSCDQPLSVAYRYVFATIAVLIVFWHVLFLGMMLFPTLNDKVVQIVTANMKGGRR